MTRGTVCPADVTNHLAMEYMEYMLAYFVRIPNVSSQP